MWPLGHSHVISDMRNNELSRSDGHSHVNIMSSAEAPIIHAVTCTRYHT